MFRKLVTVCYLVQSFLCQEIDWNICPDGLTPSPSDSRWPKIFPTHFEILAEVTTDVGALEVAQLFIGPHRDMISLRDHITNMQIYYDFQLNEKLTINEELICDRSEIQSNEYLPFIISQFIKPSILLGFNGRNHYNETFYTRYMGKEIVRGGILTAKFQSCFYIDQHNLTVNATYYLSQSFLNGLNDHTAPDILQIDVQTNDYPYTYNIIRYGFNPSLIISTPSGAFCSNRIDTKRFPQNLPSHLFVHAEAYTLESDFTSSKIDSYSHLIDQTLAFEQIDYSTKDMSTTNRLLIDYSTNLTYLYTPERQQCTVMNTSAQSMGTTSELLFQFGNQMNDSIEYHYTGLSQCGREHIQCHRWIGQREMDHLIEQYQWFWSAKYNEMDLKELRPIKANLKTTLKSETPIVVNQEINIFNYNPLPNFIEEIDSSLGQCYRALGSSHHFNYAVLRLILNNDAKHSVHRYLLALENQLHIQLANDLQIRHIRLSSFVIDILNQEDKDIFVTFTLLDNPPSLSNSFNERSLFKLIRQLNRQINGGNFHVRVDDGAFDLLVRPASLQIIVLSLSPSKNHSDYFNEPVFVYKNVTQSIFIQRRISIYKLIGPHIVALWAGSAFLGLIVTLVIGFFIALRK